MQINNDLQSSTLRPIQRSSKHIISTSNIWLSIPGNNRPVTDGNTNVVQTRTSNLAKVTLRNPRVPVTGQTTLSFSLTEGLSEAIFIFNTVAVAPLAEYRWGDPWLQHKPATKVHAANLLVVVEFEAVALPESS